MGKHFANFGIDFRGKKVLDIGSGWGDDMLEAKGLGAEVIGIESVDERVGYARMRGLEAYIGWSEELPWPDQTFDFVNLSQVIEHVKDARKTIEEVDRVLKVGGKAYVSVPPRFCILDPHAHLLFINWMPRRWVRWYLRLRHRELEYRPESNDQLDTMFYYTVPGFRKIVPSNMTLTDLRLRKIPTLLRPIYYVAREIYFDSNHLLLTKVAPGPKLEA